MPPFLAAAAATLLLMLMAAGARGDIAADRAECTDKLMGLATCLTYVQEGAKPTSPTPDCCAGLKTVLQTSRKCLCVLVKDKDDPQLNLKINVTRALGLPASCNAPANISDCPRLLNLPPNSKEAQVFEQYAKEAAAAAAAQGGAPAAAGGANTHKNGAVPAVGPVRWLGVVGKAGFGARGAAVLSAAAPLAVPFLMLLG